MFQVQVIFFDLLKELYSHVESKSLIYTSKKIEISFQKPEINSITDILL